MNTASLNSTTVQGGHVFQSRFSSLISLEEDPQLQLDKYTSQPIIWGLYLCIFYLFKGQMLGYNLGKF